MKITHNLRKKGGKWTTCDGVAEWTRDEFTRAGFMDYAYRFDNGDMWDKVNGWRELVWRPAGAVIEYDPKTCSPEQVGKYRVDGWINNDLKVIVPKFDHWKYTSHGIMPIIEAKPKWLHFDDIYNNLNKGVNWGIWPDAWVSVSPSMRGSVHSAPSTMLLIDDYESEYLNEREQLCSRHLWQ